MGAVTPSVGSPPLARLFAIGYRQLIDSLHDRLHDRGWADVRPAFGFVLLAARDQPTSVTELAALMGMTKQAASKLVDAMVSGGYIQRGTDPQDGRQRPVTLTGRGEELLSAVEQVYAELEDGWAKLIGTSHLDRMRRDLMHILSGPGNGQLPRTTHLVAAGDGSSRGLGRAWCRARSGAVEGRPMRRNGAGDEGGSPDRAGGVAEGGRRRRSPRPGWSRGALRRPASKG